MQGVAGWLFITPIILIFGLFLSSLCPSPHGWRYVLLGVPLQTALSLFLAVMVNRQIIRGCGFASGPRLVSG